MTLVTEGVGALRDVRSSVRCQLLKMFASSCTAITPCKYTLWTRSQRFEPGSFALMLADAPNINPLSTVAFIMPRSLLMTDGMTGHTHKTNAGIRYQYLKRFVLLKCLYVTSNKSRFAAYRNLQRYFGRPISA